MKDRVLLFIYLISIIAITSIPNINFLAGLIPFYIILSHKAFLRIARKAFISILLFNLIISISYIILQLLKGKPWVEYILLINLRVFDATFLTFWFMEKVNLFRAVAFSRNLSFLLSLAYSQINIYIKNYHDFKLGFRSRTLIRPSRKQTYQFIRSIFIFFLNKSIQNSREVSLAMKSRCFNND